MRKTISRLKTGVAARLTDKLSIRETHARIEEVRTAMLDALASIDTDENVGSPKAWSDITRAADIQTLWYLRSDVLRLLSDFHGEQSGRDKLAAMTELFRGLVPPNQMPSRRRIER